MTGIISALVEAWQELRINKTRILLALIGVALSVAALTSVVGLGNLAREGFKASSEQNGGRSATLGISLYGPTQADQGKLEAAPTMASSTATKSPTTPIRPRRNMRSSPPTACNS